MLYRCCLRILVTSPLMSLQFYWLFSAPFALLWLRTVQGCYKQLGCSRCYYSRNMYFTPCKWFPPGRGRGSCMQAGTLTPAPPSNPPHPLSYSRRGSCKNGGRLGSHPGPEMAAEVLFIPSALWQKRHSQRNTSRLRMKCRLSDSEENTGWFWSLTVSDLNSPIQFPLICIELLTGDIVTVQLWRNQWQEAKASQE